MEGHPCFNKEVCHTVGRIHLPVAPKCNIQCNYCTRKHDCANENRPGVTSRLLTPPEALVRLRQALKEEPRIKVVGIAGPGDPLANSATFETLALVDREFPCLLKCLSTNGLLLPEKIDDLEALGLNSLTVTMSTIDPNVGAKIYRHFHYQGKTLKGEEGARVLIENQLEGIAAAIKKGITVKVNSVLIPGLNAGRIKEVAEKISALGVYIHNIMPLIPQGALAHLSPPTPLEIKRERKECAPYIKQMEHCRQCRADAVGLLDS